MDFLIRNRILCFFIAFTLIIVSGCLDSNFDNKEFKIEYWVQDYKSKICPRLKVDTIKNEIDVGRFSISNDDLRSISNLKLKDKRFDYSKYFGYYIDSETIDFMDRNYTVSRFIIADNKELNEAIELFYVNSYGVVIKKYHGGSYEILDRIIWYSSGKIYQKSVYFLVELLLNIYPINPPRVVN